MGLQRDAGDRNIRRTTNRFVSLLAAIAALGAIVGTTPAGAGSGSTFDDVPVGSYYGAAADWLYASGITVGIQPGCFGPSDLLTRGDAATFIFRFDGHLGNHPKGGTHPFVDVSRPYQQEPVAWLWSNGITTGTAPRRFEANRITSRGEFATLLWRYAGQPQAVHAHKFIDTTHPYQDAALSWMASTGLTAGTTAFYPDAPIDRAQAAVFLHRLAGSPIVSPSSPPTCGRTIVEVLVAGGLTPQEANCSAPFLVEFSIREINSTAQSLFPTVPMLNALMRIVDAGCLTNDRLSELIALRP